jgi:hypothetical protein
MTVGGVQEPYKTSLNNTRFIVGARSFNQVFQGESNRNLPYTSFSDKFQLKPLERNYLL